MLTALRCAVSLGQGLADQPHVGALGHSAENLLRGGSENLALLLSRDLDSASTRSVAAVDDPAV
jgi:hypothetical protein